MTHPPSRRASVMNICVAVLNVCPSAVVTA
jgi:hypothetical protein